jgi:hypothetical protein
MLLRRKAPFPYENLQPVLPRGALPYALGILEENFFQEGGILSGSSGLIFCFNDGVPGVCHVHSH